MGLKDFLESPLSSLWQLYQAHRDSPKLWLPLLAGVGFAIVTIIFILKAIRQI